MIKIDMHIFTTMSHPNENAATPKEAVKIALKRGLNGLGMADHDLLGAAKEAKKYAPKDFILLDGVEMRTNEGHLVAYGIDEWDRKFVPLPVALDYIKDHHGIALLPHPNIDIMQVSIKEPHIRNFKDTFNGMYLLSTRHLLFYNRVKEVYDKYRFTPLGCSYAHHPFEIGTIYTGFEDVEDEDDVICAIRKGNVLGPRFLKTPTGLFNTARSNGAIVKKFTSYKFGLELKERIPLYRENIVEMITEMEEFTRDSLQRALLESGDLHPDSGEDPLLQMVLDDILSTTIKKGVLLKNEDTFTLTTGRRAVGSNTLTAKVYSRYVLGLAKNFVTRSK
jgi:hypothetical protein